MPFNVDRRKARERILPRNNGIQQRAGYMNKNSGGKISMTNKQRLWTMFIVGFLVWSYGIYLIWHYTNGWVVIGVLSVIGGNNVFDKISNNISR